MSHSVSRLRATRLARSTKPFMARGGFRQDRCEGCRLAAAHCLCALRPRVPTRAGVCLLMHDIEPLKPTNTGWLIADVIADTFAFGWSRTETDPGLLTLLDDPQWQPYIVFPGEYVAPERMVQSIGWPAVSIQAIPTQKLPTEKIARQKVATQEIATQETAAQEVLKPALSKREPSTQEARSQENPAQETYAGELFTQETKSPEMTQAPHKRPLFVLLDATWPEARKMFRKSPYLDRFPVLNLQPDQLSNYRLRRSNRTDHFCTSEVAALCMALAGEPRASETLHAWLDVFTYHYLRAKVQLPVDYDDPVHQRLRGLAIV